MTAFTRMTKNKIKILIRIRINLLEQVKFSFQQVSFWPEDEENGGSELTMSSQLRKTRSMDSSCLELRLGPSSANSTSMGHHGPPPHLPPTLSRARSEANLHASTLSLGPGELLFLLSIPPERLNRFRRNAQSPSLKAKEKKFKFLGF